MLPPGRARQEGGPRRAAQRPCRGVPPFSRARPRRDQGRWAEAHGPLAPVYAASTEGFASPDCVGARVLLEELGGSGASAAPIRPNGSEPAAVWR